MNNIAAHYRADGPNSRCEIPAASTTDRYLAFNYGKRECIIPADEVSEILSSLTISRVPGAGLGIRGIAIHRGDILTVVEMAELMPDEFRTYEPGSKFLVLGNDTGASPLAISIGDTLGFTDLSGPHDDAEKPPPFYLRLRQIRKLLGPQPQD
ncbi:MAG TPA: chemotaxis protein CheW [Pyrinomonadaceae bacterium]|nr:chemotaxis protein CheW [Pyrinomonadaceae bacterium]